MVAFARWRNILFGLTAVFLLPSLTVWRFGPQLLSDLSHKHYLPSASYEVTSATCSRYVFMISHCWVKVQRRNDPSALHTMRFLSFGEWADQPLSILESSTQPIRMTIAQALDRLMDRVFAFLTLNILSIFLGIAIFDRQIGKDRIARADRWMPTPGMAAVEDDVELHEIDRPAHLGAVPRQVIGPPECNSIGRRTPL